MRKTKKNISKEQHIHRIKPILFGGSPTDTNNIVLLSRMQHAEYSTFWNRELRKTIKENLFEKTINKFNNSSNSKFKTIDTAEKHFNIIFPTDYKEFLLNSNKLESDTVDNYLVIWSISELVELNKAYHVDEFISNIIIFGSDGAEDAYAFDSSRNKLEIVKLPFIGMGYISKEKLADTFTDFIKSHL